jgi:predicted alpha/beta superfamily hydrolase
MLHSTVANQDYLISVALPFGYDEHPNKRYPVLYVLDGNLYLGIAQNRRRGERGLQNSASFCMLEGT